MSSPQPFSGHWAVPAGTGPFPAVLVIQEWWGLDDQTRRIADRLAQAGYLALAPDVYEGELAALGDHETARALVQKHAPTAPDRLAVTFDQLKSDPRCTGRVAALGFCFGGRMALEVGLRRPVDAVCTFYGGGMHALFDRLSALQAPVLGLFGSADVSIPVGTVQQFDDLLDTLGLEHTILMYPDSGHAFFRDSDPAVYRPSAAADAWARVQNFLARHLRPAE